MAHADTFEPAKFAEIMKAEVESLAEKLYPGSGNKDKAQGNAFAHWCIKNISPKLDDNSIKIARAICEHGGPGDENIDGAWIDGETLYIMQAKYSRPEIPTNGVDRFNPHAFDASPAEELWAGFSRIHHFYTAHTAKPTRKLLEVTELYKRALDNHLRIELVVAISGKPKKPLLTRTSEINAELRAGVGKYDRHFCKLYDHIYLNQVISDNLAPPPGPIYLTTIDRFRLKNDDDTTYAIAATVDAEELIRMRKDNGYNIYHANFRFLLTAGIARPKMEATLKDPVERRNFWRYNNGVTISCRTVSEETQTKLRVDGLQVVNGLQTVETLYDNRQHEDWLNGVRLLVRVIPTARDASPEADETAKLLEEHIAEYSNSQTPIRPRDLRANDPVQIEIERIFSEVYDLTYVRKVGLAPGRPPRQRVDMKDAAQAALSFWHGLAQEAKTKSSLIFEKVTSAPPGYYEKVFTQGKTKSEYVLLPFLLWDNEYEFIKRVTHDYEESAFEYLDLLALAVVGEQFKAIFGLGPSPSASEASTKRLKCAIDEVNSWSPRRRVQNAKRIWKPILESLLQVAESIRTSEARRNGLDPEDISFRNIAVKMKFTDGSLFRQIMQKPRVKSCRRVLRGLFPC